MHIAFAARGFAYAKLGQDELALKDYGMAIAMGKIFPNSGIDLPNVYLNRGLSNAKIDNPVAAILDFTNAIELDPGMANAYASRGLAYSQQDQT